MKTKNEKQAENFLQRNNFHNDKFHLLEKLNSRGGGFVKKLAECLWLADSQNYKIGIKAYWHIIKSYIETELYEVTEGKCLCGEEENRVYYEVSPINTIYKNKDEWVSIIGLEEKKFICNQCHGLMPEEIRKRVFGSDYNL